MIEWSGRDPRYPDVKPDFGFSSEDTAFGIDRSDPRYSMVKDSEVEDNEVYGFYPEDFRDQVDVSDDLWEVFDHYYNEKCDEYLMERNLMCSIDAAIYDWDDEYSTLWCKIFRVKANLKKDYASARRQSDDYAWEMKKIVRTFLGKDLHINQNTVAGLLEYSGEDDDEYLREKYLGEKPQWERKKDSKFFLVNLFRRWKRMRGHVI